MEKKIAGLIAGLKAIAKLVPAAALPIGIVVTVLLAIYGDPTAAGF